jgi:hypothetical protein
MSRVWEKSQHGGANLLMLLAIADFSDDRGRAYPSVSTLAQKCRVKPRAANYSIAELRDSGELRVFVSKGPRGCNLFHIALDQLGLQQSAPMQSGAGVQEIAGVKSYAGVQEVAPLQKGAQTPAISCASPLHRVAPEPSLNRQEPSVPREPVGFALFWQAWPSNNRKGGKAKCLDTWRKAGIETDAQIVLSHVEQMKASPDWKKQDGAFVPAPLTYLNGRRWDGADDSGVADRWAGAIN